MARKIGKTETGEQMFGYDLQDVELIAKGQGMSDFEIEMIATTEAIDRDGEILSIDGWKINNYKKNPVILANHNYYAPVIGRAKSVKIKDGKMVVRIEFPEEGVNPEADVFRKLYKAGFMKAGSIGFIPLKWEYGDGKNTDYYRKFTEQEMLEFSLVSVPANPEALINGEKGFKAAVDEGVISKDEMDLVIKAIYEGIEAPLKKDFGVFSITKEADDGADEPEQPVDPEEKDDEVERPEDPKPENDETEAQKRYHEKMIAAISEYIKSDDGRDLIKEVLREEIKLLSDKGLSNELAKHYSEVLFGAEDEDPENDSKGQDELDAVIKEAISEGLTKKESSDG